MVRTAVESQARTFMEWAARNIAEARRMQARGFKRPLAPDAGGMVRSVKNPMIRPAIESQVLTFLARAAQNVADARRMLTGGPERPLSPDAGDLVRVVHDATVPGLDGSTPVEVERIITLPPVYLGLGAMLERAGIALTEGQQDTGRPDLEGKTCIFLDVATLLKKLLPPVWQDVDAEVVLMNGLRGASRQQRVCDGRQTWGIEVPLAEWHAASFS